jgi:hypothetical protein
MNQGIAQAQESAMGANGVPKGIINLYHRAACPFVSPATF